MPDDFPILGGKTIKSIPWAMLAPHEAQAQRNHYQTLKRLAERGGLGADEALFVLRNGCWTGKVFMMPKERAARDAYLADKEKELIVLVAQWKQQNEATS